MSVLDAALYVEREGGYNYGAVRSQPSYLWWAGHSLPRALQLAAAGDDVGACSLCEATDDGSEAQRIVRIAFLFGGELLGFHLAIVHHRIPRSDDGGDEEHARQIKKNASWCDLLAAIKGTLPFQDCACESLPLPCHSMERRGGDVGGWDQGM